MTIELIKEAFKVEELKGMNETQVLVETEIYLGPSKPSIEKIMWVQGKIEILNTKIIKDKLLISGLVKFNLVYSGLEEENNIHTLETTKDFKEEIEIEGITEEMIVKVKPKLEYIEEELEENKIQLRSLISIWGKVDEIKTLETIKDIKAKDDLQILKEKISYKEVYGRETSYALLKETFKIPEDKPNIDEILKLSIDVKEVESMVVEDRIIISGEAKATVIYFGDNQISSIKETIPFNHFLDIEGVHRESKGEINFEVVEGIYEITENEIGESKFLDLEIKIKVSGKVFDEKSMDLVIDAYSTKDNILIEREEVNFRENIKDIIHDEVLSQDINNIEAKEVFEVVSHLNILEKRYLDNKILIEGIVALEINYLDKLTEEINTFKEDIPYKAYVETEGIKSDVLIDLDAKVDNVRYSLKKDGVFVEANIRHKLNLSRKRKLYGIKEIKDTGETIDKRNKPSIIIYIVQKGDKLWDIAKRYNTTIEEILSSNRLSSTYEIQPGDKIIIEKKVELAF